MRIRAFFMAGSIGQARPPVRGPRLGTGGVRAPGGLPRLQSGWDGRSPSGGFDSRPPPPPALSARWTRTAAGFGAASMLLCFAAMKKLIVLIVIAVLAALAVKKLQDSTV